MEIYMCIYGRKNHYVAGAYPLSDIFYMFLFSISIVCITP